MNKNKGKILIVAEAGVNHNGSLDQAMRLVDAAAEAGADAVKFQTFKAAKLISRYAGKAEYARRNTGDEESHLEMVRALELDAAAHRRLVAHCARRAILFLSTPFEEDSLRFLARSLRVPLVKIPSGEVTNGPLLVETGRTGLAAVVSTGMSTLGEVEEALGALAYGYLGGRGGKPCLRTFMTVLRDPAAWEALRGKVTLLHCTTEYPAPMAEVNLRAMDTLREAFGLPVGYSDHTPGIHVSVAAAARGASYIEKHFTLDRTLPGPDHRASLEPGELAALVRAVRDVELALGTPRKAPVPSEAGNIDIARKVLVAARRIARGERFTRANLAAKRCGRGISAMRYWEWLGRAATRAYAPDQMVVEG